MRVQIAFGAWPPVAVAQLWIVRHQAVADFLAVDLSGDFGGSEADGDAATGLRVLGLSR